jgi:preprotein translocase subunit SecE
VTETQTGGAGGSRRAGGSGGARPARRDGERAGLFARIGLFLRQVVAELKKVVRPTRQELITYTSVVLVFVLAVMLYVSGLDFTFGKLVLLVFGGSGG